jgi:serine O-acetyltransferase
MDLNEHCACMRYFPGERAKASGISLYLSRMKFAFFQLGFLPWDIASAYRKDPALRGKLLGILELATYAGVWAILLHRIAHLLFAAGIPVIPRLLSQVARLLTGIEIHSGARIGRGFFIDHGNGVVIGETAEIGNDVLLYHQVTLGSAGGMEAGKRHPTVGSHVTIGAGAKILGPVTIGQRSVIGAGSIVTKSIPPFSVAVGNPARVIRTRECQQANEKSIG